VQKKKGGKEKTRKGKGRTHHRQLFYFEMGHTLFFACKDVKKGKGRGNSKKGSGCCWLATFHAHPVVTPGFCCWDKKVKRGGRSEGRRKGTVLNNILVKTF